METVELTGADKAARYRELLPQLAALVDGEPDLIANLANTCAALRECVTARARQRLPLPQTQSAYCIAGTG